MEHSSNHRCRLIAAIGAHIVSAPKSADYLERVFEGGDIAAAIFDLADLSLDESIGAKPCIEAAQNRGIAAIIRGGIRGGENETDSELAVSLGADGYMLADLPRLRAALEDSASRSQGRQRLTIGAGPARTRHQALLLGECEPDYLMFGDLREEAHPQPAQMTLELGGWWAQLTIVPCVLAGGTDVRGIIAMARTGADFAALGSAIFGTPADIAPAREAARRIKHANELLDEHAPAFET